MTIKRSVSPVLNNIRSFDSCSNKKIKCIKSFLLFETFLIKEATPIPFNWEYLDWKEERRLLSREIKKFRDTSSFCKTKKHLVPWFCFRRIAFYLSQRLIVTLTLKSRTSKCIKTKHYTPTLMVFKEKTLAFKKMLYHCEMINLIFLLYFR